MDGVRFDLVRLTPPFSVEVHVPDASLFYYVISGKAWLEAPPLLAAPTQIPVGTALAMGHGRHHVWRHAARARADIPSDELRTVPFGSPSEPGAVEILRGHIDRRNAALATPANELVLIPADTPPYSAVFRSVAGLLEAELRTPQLDREAVERRIAEIIVIQLVRFSLGDLSPEMARLPARAMQDDRILRAVTAFHHAPARDWTVGALAETAGLSRAAFAERFHVVMGEPPMAYVGRLRMQRASASLRVGRRSLLDVAQSVGYQSEAAFIRAFQRQFGLSPGRWRRQARAQTEEAP